MMEMEKKDKILLKKEDKLLLNLMVDKSKQSFLLAIELFNKPTIKINVEGFCIFICNAWELLFKAYLLKNGKSIYYKVKGKNTNRSFDLSKLINLVLTNNKDPLRINLETVVGIRNKATHLVIPEYSNLLHDVFSACVKNYTEKLNSLLGIDITNEFDSTFISLVIPTNKTNYTILGKYGKTIDSEFYNISKYLDESYKRNSKDNIVNSHYAIKHTIDFVRVKNIDEAAIKIANYKDNESKKVVEVVKTKDPSETHPLNRKKVLEIIQEQMKNTGLEFTPYTLSGNKKFTSDTFNLYVKITNAKQNIEYSYEHVIGNTKQYTYSYKLVEKIIQDITNDPDIFVKNKN